MNACEHSTVVASTYTERLKLAFDESKKSVQELAVAVGISYQGARKALLGETKSLTARNNEKAAEFLKVSPRWLAAEEGPMRIDGGSHLDAKADEAAVRASLRTLRKRLAQCSAEQTEAAARALALLARVPDSDRVYEDAVLALLEKATFKGPVPEPITAETPVNARAEALRRRFAELPPSAQEAVYPDMLQALEQGLDDQAANQRPPKAAPLGKQSPRRVRAR